VTPEPIPTGVRLCRAADLLARHEGAQGAGGWWTGTLLLTSRAEPCLIHGLVELRFLDPLGHEIVRSMPSASGAFRDWAVVGEAQVQWLLSNWCEPRPTVGAILVLLPGDPTPVVARLDPPMGVGARCNSADGGADGVKGATTMSVGRRPTLEPITSPPPARIAARIDAPSTAVAGDTLRYVVTLTNLTTDTLVLDPCPSYVESLGGQALPTPAPPSNWPTFKPWSPIVPYAGVAKESHLLNCGKSPSIAAGASISFEMRLAVPADALGSDTLRWGVIAGLGDLIASSPITIVPR